MTRKVLIVDDEVTCTLFLGAFLEDNGYLVKTAISGTEALEVGEQFKPDILITDWMLKDQTDGLDVAQSLIAANSSLKVIFITGMAAETLQEKLVGLADYEIIEKPVELDDILRKIDHNQEN